MSKKTMKQRIALVAVSALTAGLFSVVSAPVANAAPSDLTAGTAPSTGVVTAYSVTGAAGTATITTAGVLSLNAAVTTGGAVNNVTITGGTFVGASSVIVFNSAGTLGTTAADTAIVSLLAKPTAAGQMVIKSYAGATSGTAVTTVTVTVVPAENVGTFSASKSFAAGVTTAASGAHSTNVDVAFSLQAANGGQAIIAFSLLDGNGVPMSTSTVVTATATNGAVVAFSSGAQLGASASKAYQGTFENIYVAQGTKYAAIDTVVTLAVNGVPYTSKAIALQGDVTKITLNDNVLGKLGQSTSNAYFTTMTDALGHKIGGLTASVDATQYNTTVTSVAVAATTANTGAAVSALFTCGTVAGKTPIKLTYTNPTSLVKITSNTLDLTCGGAPHTWSASFDKASYVPGDVATLSITAKDISGAVVNDIDTMGANITITGSQLTAVVLPVTGDKFTSGVKKYRFLVGSTQGSYNAVVDIPSYVASQAAQTLAYKVGGDVGVSNADVLKSIVALIASINKQIQALQKLILARR